MAKIYTGIETIKALQEGKVLVRKDEDGGNNYLKMVGGKLFYKIDNLAVDDPNVWRSDADAPDDGAYPYCLDELLSWRFKEHEEHEFGTVVAIRLQLHERPNPSFKRTCLRQSA